MLAERWTPIKILDEDYLILPDVALFRDEHAKESLHRNGSGPRSGRARQS